MQVLGHYDYGVKVVAFSVVVKAVLEHGVPGVRGGTGRDGSCGM
jgi:hypothetical protein